jgi:hypothetical protein
MSKNLNRPIAFLVGAHIEFQQNQWDGSRIRLYINKLFMALCKLGSLSINMSDNLELNENPYFELQLNLLKDLWDIWKSKFMVLYKPGFIRSQHGWITKYTAPLSKSLSRWIWTVICQTVYWTHENVNFTAPCKLSFTTDQYGKKR